MSMTQIACTVMIGIGASLMMDGWNLIVKWVFGLPSLNYCLLGRWVRHMAEGKFAHNSISAAEPRSFECAVGWFAHLGIGVTFAFGLVSLVSADWLEQPKLLPALIYGIATVVFPFFLMQPALGLGIASARSPHPAQARIKSLATHTVFGVGLYLCALGVSRLLFPQ